VTPRRLVGLGALVWLVLVAGAIATRKDHGKASAATRTTAPAAPAAPATTVAPAPAPTATVPVAVVQKLSATLAAGTLTLQGTVPDQKAHDAVVGGVRQAFGADHVVDQLNVSADVQAAPWATGFPAIAARLATGVKKGSVTADEHSITVAGIATSAKAKAALLTAAAAAGGAGVQVVDRVTIVRPPAATANVGRLQRSVTAILRTQGVQFQTDSFVLTSVGRRTLDRIAALLAGARGTTVEIRGYTDSIGAAAVNLRVSQRRAEAVRAYLVSRGIAASRLSARGFGPANPIASNVTAIGRAINRRIEMKIRKG
jgi:OOP family OmpA-OmpF porin